MNKLANFITPSYAIDRVDNYSDIELDMAAVKKPIPDMLMDRFQLTLIENKNVHDIYFDLIDKPSRSEKDFALAGELKHEGFTLEETGNILWNFPHGKNTELKKREIVRCYIRSNDRSNNDFIDAIDPAHLALIEVQANPILVARKAALPLAEDLGQSARFRAVKLSGMDWHHSGRPIYKDFLYEKAITVVYGQSNTGKSFVVTDISGHVALGRDWAGMKYKPKKGTGILYICAEAGKSFGKRGRVLLKKLGIPDLPFFVIDAAPSFIREDKADAEAIVKEIKRLRQEKDVEIMLVVVDTLATTFEGGNENSSEHMGMYISNMKWIQRYGDTGVLIVHHSGKAQAAGARGHSSLRAATDTEIEVIAEQKGESYHRRIEVKKQREGQNGKVFKFGLQVVELGKDDEGDSIDSCYVVLEGDTEFESVFCRPEDELAGTKKAAYLTLQKFLEPDFLQWCEGKKRTDIRKLILKHWFLIKNDPEKILSLEELQNTNPNYHYDSESSNFSRDYIEIRQYLDKTELSLDQWIKECLVIPSQSLSG